MQLIFFYNNPTKNLVPMIQDLCNEKGAECLMFDVDEDPEVMTDYNVSGAPPAIVIFDNYGHRVVTHKGRITKEKLKDILSTLD